MKRHHSSKVGGLLCLLLCSLAGAAWALPPPAPVPLPNLKAAAQDGTGTVWGLPNDNNGYDRTQYGKIYRWQTGSRASGKPGAGSWAEQDVPDAAGFSPVAIAHGDDGSVYALWQKRDPGWYPGQTQAETVSYLLTVQRGTRSRVQSRFTATLPVPGPFSGPLKLYAGKGGDAWIVGDSPVLLHVSSNGTVQSFSVTPDQVFGGKLGNAFAPHTFGSTTDPLGRRWFWQANQDSWEQGALRGFLIWDGKTLAYHPTLPGLPDLAYTVVVPHGGRFLWAAQVPASDPNGRNAHGGFYKIDTQTLTATEAALPPKDVLPPKNILPKAAQQAASQPAVIQRVFWIQGDLCLLEINFFSFNRLELWRLHGDAWHKEPDALAASQYNYGNQSDPTPDAVLDTPQGTWLTISNAGLDWLSADGKTVIPVNWRRGLAAGRVSDLFRMTNGDIMPFPYYGFGGILPPLPPPLLPPRPGVTIGGPGQPSGMGDMLTGQQHHLWGIVYKRSGTQVLDEWDGQQWHAHPVPKLKGSSPGASLYDCDTLGRIWVTVSIWNPPAQAQPVDARLVYDPAHDTWAQYPTVPEALAAAAAEPGMAFLPYHNTPLPVFSGDGRAAYADNPAVFLYDGKQWRHWNAHDIQPRNLYSNAPSNPRFDEDGHLEVALDTHLYDWIPETGWQPNGIAPPVSPPPPLPPGGPPGLYGQPVRDNAGGGWVNFGSDVYLIRYGQWRKIAALSGRGSPFWDSRSIQDVLQDPLGRYFFETNPGSFYEYVVWTPPAAHLPPPRIQIAPLSADSVRLRFPSARKEMPAQNGPRELQWRLNGGAWSAPLSGRPVTLTALKPGTYRVEAQAINALLQASPAPSFAVFTVQPPTTAQIAAWVQTLRTGTDDAREGAVTGLLKVPAAALPALRAARPSASEAGQWWIDATIQQITEEAQAGTNGER